MTDQSIVRNLDELKRMRESTGDAHSMTRTPLRPLSQRLVKNSRYNTPILPHIHQHEFDLTGCGVEKNRAQGDYIDISGTVFNQAGRAVPDLLIEMWAANCFGQYAREVSAADNRDPNHAGCGRCYTDQHGTYRFITPMPGAYLASPSMGWWRPSHLHLSILGRGARLITQVLFPDNPLNDQDFTLQAVKDEIARSRLLAVEGRTRRHSNGRSLYNYQFDIHLWVDNVDVAGGRAAESVGTTGLSPELA